MARNAFTISIQSEEQVKETESLRLSLGNAAPVSVHNPPVTPNGLPPYFRSCASSLMPVTVEGSRNCGSDMIPVWV